MKIDGLPRRRSSDVIIGSCAAMKKVLDQVSIGASSTHPVFLIGESGTGKELVARTIHGSGARAKGVFVSIHCAVIPDVLLEGELFGLPDDNPLSRFTRGPGLVAEAENGTLFLDQLEAVPRELQSRLLTVLTESEALFRTDGPKTPPHLIAASTGSARGGVKASRFDPDLLRSLENFSITLPPLRDRSEDIQLLAAHFLNIFSQEIPTPARSVSAEAGARMSEYGWPGNVRELENKLRQAVLVARNEELSVDDLFLQHPAILDKVPSFKEAKRHFERQYISQVLRASHGNISRAARLAQKDRKDFYDVMRRNGIDPKTFRNKDNAT